METIQDLGKIYDALREQGHDAKMDLELRYITVPVGGAECPFTTILTINEERTKLTFTCQIMTNGQIVDEARDTFLWSALDNNSIIHPFAIAILTDTDGEGSDESQWPIVLINSVPLGDFTKSELSAAMSSLLNAIMGSKHVISIGLGKIKIDDDNDGGGGIVTDHITETTELKETNPLHSH